ncbi:MAG: Hsp33 family molecular chaperone HslO [Deltaproteobacteria bacterium]|nr:Hsp33 family molecular chaperone HslO [Deltaproteobacteria bacterium]
MSVRGDRLVRAMTDDGSFRVVTADTTLTVRGALAAQEAVGETARVLGDLVTGVLLTRITMAPALRVQGVLRGPAGQLVADSHPSGKTRALVTRGPDGGLDLSPGPSTLLRMMRTLHDGRLSQGVVGVTSPSMSVALMEYMETSEQVTTMLAVGTRLGEAGVERAGGYLVQLLPGAARGPLMLMTERLEDFRSVDAWLARDDFTPEALLADLLYGLPHTWLGEDEAEFGCWCSRLGVTSALSTLPRTELESMVSAGEVLEIRCDYCGEEYRVPPAELRGLTATS